MLKEKMTDEAKADLWEKWSFFTEHMGLIIGNTVYGNDGGKQYNENFSLAWVYAVQFWLKIKANSPEIWDRIDSQELLKIKNSYYNEDELNEFLGKHIPLTNAYRQIMNTQEKGIIDKKGKHQHYKPSYMDLCIVSDFMASYVYEAKINNMAKKNER